jgi:hypothetical protein
LKALCVEAECANGIIGIKEPDRRNEWKNVISMRLLVVKE